MAKIDKDTQKVLDKMKASHEWVNSSGYERFKKLLMEKIVMQTSLLRLQPLPNASTEAIARDYAARQMLGSLLVTTLQELEGEANSYESNLRLLNEVEQDSLMAYFPEKETN